MDQTLILAEFKPIEHKRLAAIGFTHLVEVTFHCGAAFQREGYIPMSELLKVLTDWRIGIDEAHPEHTPIAVKFSIVEQVIIALYDVEHKQLLSLAERLEDTHVCEGAFFIKVYGVAGLHSFFK